MDLTCLEMSRDPEASSCVRVHGRLFANQNGVSVQTNEIEVRVPSTEELTAFPRVGEVVEGGLVMGFAIPLVLTNFKGAAIPLMFITVPVGLAGGVVTEAVLLPATAWTQFVTVPVRKKKLRRALEGKDVRVSHRTFQLFSQSIFPLPSTN